MERTKEDNVLGVLHMFGAGLCNENYNGESIRYDTSNALRA